MNFKSSFQMPILALACVLTLSAAASGTAMNMIDDVAPTENKVSEGTQYTGIVTMEHQRDTDGDGTYETVETYKDSNIITDQGLNFFECTAAGVSCPSATSAGTASGSDNAIYISLSQDSTEPQAGDESITDEITSGNLTRSEGSVSDVDTGHYSVEYTFTADSDFNDETIEKTGLHWSGNNADDDLVAANTFPGVTMLSDDKLTISWTEVSFSR